MELSDVNWNIEYDGEDFGFTLFDTAIQGCQWKPEGEVKFNYVFVHGLSVFVTFKKDFFPFVTQLGGMVFATDHIGHGRSAGSRVSCTIDEIVEETKRVILHAEETNPNVPLILHGHSMGGLSVLMLALKFPDFLKEHVNGLIAEAPWISSCPQRQPGCFVMGLIRMLNGCCGTMGLDGGVRHFSDDNDPTWVKLISESPLFAPVATPRNYVSAQDSITWLRANYNLYPEEVPLLFLQGKKDDLVNAEESDEWINQLINAKPKATIEYHQYPEGPHVMMKTKIRPTVITDVLNWMNARLGGPKAEEKVNNDAEVNDEGKEEKEE